MLRFRTYEPLMLLCVTSSVKVTMESSCGECLIHEKVLYQKTTTAAIVSVQALQKMRRLATGVNTILWFHVTGVTITCAMHVYSLTKQGTITDTKCARAAPVVEAQTRYHRF